MNRKVPTLTDQQAREDKDRNVADGERWKAVELVPGFL